MTGHSHPKSHPHPHPKSHPNPHPNSHPNSHPNPNPLPLPLPYIYPHIYPHTSNSHRNTSKGLTTVTCGSKPPVQLLLKSDQGVLCDNETIYIQVIPKMKSHGSTRISCNDTTYKLEENQKYSCTEDGLFVEVMQDMVYKSAGAKMTTKTLLVFLLGMSALVL